MKTRIVPVLFALCLLAAAPCSVNAATYTPIDLGTLPGAPASSGYGINNQGQVVGDSYVNNIGTAAIWNGTTATARSFSPPTTSSLRCGTAPLQPRSDICRVPTTVTAMPSSEGKSETVSRRGTATGNAIDY